MLFHQIHQGMTQTYMVGTHFFLDCHKHEKKIKAFIGSATADSEISSKYFGMVWSSAHAGGHAPNC